jgi:hypothetical protein
VLLAAQLPFPVTELVLCKVEVEKAPPHGNWETPCSKLCSRSRTPNVVVQGSPEGPLYRENCPLASFLSSLSSWPTSITVCDLHCWNPVRQLRSVHYARLYSLRSGPKEDSRWLTSICPFFAQQAKPANQTDWSLPYAVQFRPVRPTVRPPEAAGGGPSPGGLPPGHLLSAPLYGQRAERAHHVRGHLAARGGPGLVQRRAGVPLPAGPVTGGEDAHVRRAGGPSDACRR